ncbi:MOZ/SAS family protein [Hirsutella rhossiliensis]|uniref:histone acetyltransferase n=1 Tax=Hirsutella rhossiliensis TaxID=111463 RepID=A0A9P8N1W5_9HYPO|nr:MOZ/SAS family domain-containing protein [Hirsutella rhossiliensis]KAH0965402.1 MOZ/SAS family domain-containing protein [Hirsutella rhossiliensis]
MPPKRKRPAAAAPNPEPAVTRRATRQTPVEPPPTSAKAPPPLPATPALPTTQTPVPIPAPLAQLRRSREGVVVAPRAAPAPAGARSSLAQSAPLASRRRLAPAVSAATAAPGAMAGAAVKENARPSDLVAPEITYHVPQPHQPGRAPTSLVRPHGPSAPPPPPRLDSRPQTLPPPMVVTPVPPPRPLNLPTSHHHHHHNLHHNRNPPRPDRNIDKVVLGNLCFRTWYPSQYGKEVLGDSSGNAKTTGGGGGGKDGGKEQHGGKPSSKKDQPMLERLYVCPSCFKYAKELVAWRGHVRLCERRAHVPGTKMYVHPRGRRTVLVAHDGKAPGTKRRRGDGGVRYVEEVVEDEGEWSIWEVDGEKDGLFCQNLSLFAKLFLDNKSVFFDVTGFKYYLLVYTPPAPKTSEAGPPRPQITGFFSKEKMSWDNNNLACILVFPPWQRKGLGGLLMGASYEMSRREGILGGPEKPISDLGKKGYKRFWSGAVARWLLGLETREGGETIVDVNDVSRGTWISADDCLGVLRDMGVVKDAGVGPGKPETAAEAAGPESETTGAASADAGAPTATTTTTASISITGDEDALGGQRPHDAGAAGQLRARVRLDKAAVRRFVAAHGISLEPTCDPRGFVDGHALEQAARADEGGRVADEGGET